MGLWQGTSSETLQQRPVRRQLESSCSRGTQAHSEGSRKEAAAFMGTQHMQHRQHAEERGQRRGFYLFSPSSPGISKPWPRAPSAPSSGQPGGLQCGNQAQGWLCWVSGQPTGAHLQIASGGLQVGCLLG